MDLIILNLFLNFLFQILLIFAGICCTICFIMLDVYFTKSMALFWPLWFLSYFIYKVDLKSSLLMQNNFSAISN